MFGTFQAGDITIFGKGKSTHVVLINNISCDSISLRFKEMACPQNIARLIIEADKFALGGALGGYLLLGGGASSSTFPESKKATGVALAIVVSLVRCIDIPFNQGEGVCKEGKGKVLVQIEFGLSEYGGNKKVVQTDGLLAKHQN